MVEGRTCPPAALLQICLDSGGRGATASAGLPVPTVGCSGGPGGRTIVGSTDTTTTTPPPPPHRGVPTALSGVGHTGGENGL